MKGIFERNTLLIDNLSESIHYQNKMLNLSEDLHIKVEDAIRHHLDLTKELEENTHQFESLKLRFTKKVSKLEISYSEKDVCIKMLKEELDVQKGIIDD